MTSMFDMGERMRLALGDRSMRDANEARVLAKLFHGVSPYIAKGYLEARGERRHNIRYGTFVIDDCLDAFRHRFASMRKVALRARSAFNDGFGTHTPIFFVFLHVACPARALNNLPGLFILSCAHIAAHDS